MSEEGAEWGDAQDYPDEAAATEGAEDETDDIAQDENSGRYNDWKSYQKIPAKLTKTDQRGFRLSKIHNQTITINRMIRFSPRRAA